MPYGVLLTLAALLTAAVLAALTLPSAASAQRLPWPETECVPGAPGLLRTSSTCGATLSHGRAIPPPSAPAAVQRVIRAANHIDGRPYIWGGGHRSFRSKGYDCSGAVSYVLHAARLLDYTMVSGQLAHWGERGPGRWITIYANANHVFMEIAGLRFDTREDLPGVTGPRWHLSRASPKHFASRHPAGL